MIELVSDGRCIRCNLCVEVCPTNVFDGTADELPVIARQEDCQTCFMCEVYCPVDALYVAPHAEKTTPVEEDALVEGGLLGSYRKAVGWGGKRTPGAASDDTHRLLRAARL